MLYTFNYDNVEYSNFNLDDEKVVNNLIERGVSLEFIDSIKSKDKTLVTDLDIVHEILLDMTLERIETDIKMKGEVI